MGFNGFSRLTDKLGKGVDAIKQGGRDLADNILSVQGPNSSARQGQAAIDKINRRKKK